MKTKSVPPRRIIEVKQMYEVVNLTDARDRFVIEADNKLEACREFLEKLGYRLHKTDGGGYFLVDLDDPNRLLPMDATNVEAAYAEVLEAARWEIREPTTLVGGKQPLYGFGEESDYE